MGTTVLRPDNGQQMVPGPSQAFRAQNPSHCSQEAVPRSCAADSAPTLIDLLLSSRPSQRDGVDSWRLSACGPQWCSLLGDHDKCECVGRWALGAR